MRWRDYIIPDEVQSAHAAAADMLFVARQTSHFWLKQLFAFAIPLLVGVGFGLLFIELSCGGINQNGLGSVFKDVVTVIMTLASVLAGFMVTLMLFTGRTSGSNELTVDDAPVYVAKISYLLFSQSLTLIIHVGCVASGLIWLILNSIPVDVSVINTVFCLVLGFACLSLARTLLLPFQIYEVHHFELSAMVNEKNKKFREELKRQESSLRPNED